MSAKEDIVQQRVWLCFGASRELMKVMDRVGSQLGFLSMEFSSPESLLVAVEGAWDFGGILVVGNPQLADSVRAQSAVGVVIALDPDTSADELLLQLDKAQGAEVPENLVQLITTAIRVVSERVFGVSLKWQRSLDFKLAFGSRSICDAVAEGFVGKASCEMNFDLMRKNLSRFEKKTDRQLQDAGGEICNQVLGIVNSALRAQGLRPMISLPISIELGKNQGVAQARYMPHVRFVDSTQMIALGVLVRIDRTCKVNWASLETGLPTDEVDFL
jgi:hypothetical protein